MTENMPFESTALPVRRQWTQGKIVWELQQFHKSGLKLQRETVRRANPALYRAISAHFGLFEDAIRAAGFEPETPAQKADPVPGQVTGSRLPSQPPSQGKHKPQFPPRAHCQMSREQLVEWIKQRQAEGKPVNYNTLKKGFRPLLMCAKRVFGTWQAAMVAAGVDYADLCHQNRFIRYYKSKDDIVVALRERITKGQSVKYEDVRWGDDREPRLIKYGTQLFGSWRNAVIAAGGEYVGRIRKPERYGEPDEVLAEIKHRAIAGVAANMKYVTEGEYKNFALMKKAIAHFGSWRKAVDAAGLSYTPLQGGGSGSGRRYETREAVLAGILRRKQDGKPLAYKCLEHGPFPDRSLRDSGKSLFGSWQQAVEAAGIAYDTVSLRNGRPRKMDKAFLPEPSVS